ncbi:MAG: hypothetical protein COA79_17685 [Planctomycetota bacterium]|nr:MAG: hypothetical protein COA79_17685 [Planctomycetota bacterium]
MENGISNLAASQSLVAKSITSSDPVNTEKSSNPPPSESNPPKAPTSIEDTVTLSREGLLEAARGKVSKSTNENGSVTISVNGKDIDGRSLEASSSGLKFGQSFARPESDLVDLTGDDQIVKTRGGSDLAIIDGDDSVIDVGDGDDEVFITGTSNDINLGGGTDNLSIVGDDNSVRESDDDDNVIINGNGNTIKTGKGDDSIIADSDQSLILTGNGDDSVEIVGGENTISTSIGDDVLKVEGDSNNIFGGAGNDSVEVSGNDNLILTSSGDDTIVVSGSNNAIFAGSGDDTINIGSTANIPSSSEVTEIDSVETADVDSDDVNNDDDDSESTTVIFAGSGDDTITLEDNTGEFRIEGGSGENTLDLVNIALSDIKAELDGKVLELTNGDETLELKIKDFVAIKLSDGQTYSVDDLLAATESNQIPDSDDDDLALPIEANILQAQDSTVGRAINRLLEQDTSGNVIDIVG